MVKNNVFVISTEYHFLLAMTIIENNFSACEFQNKLVLTGRRLSNIDVRALPFNVNYIKLHFDDNEDLKSRVQNEIFNEKVLNLFVVHTYRALETYILSVTPKSTIRHLMQDGALFYLKIEKSLFLNRIRETTDIYRKLWKKGILLKKLIFYPRHMENSPFIDELWMTNPEIYINPRTKKKINRIILFPDKSVIPKFNSFFKMNESVDFRGIEDCLIYLAPIIRDVAKMEQEVLHLKKMLEKVRKSRLLIKLHPGMRDKTQFNLLKRAFGDVVIQNYVPAEMYVANAIDSYLVGSASTALFYNSEGCKCFALKKYYQKIGIYASWKNVSLPAHVKIINDLDDFND